MRLVDVADGDTLEMRRKVFDAAFPPLDRGGFHRVPDGVQPTLRNFRECCMAVLRKGERGDLLAKFAQPARGQSPVGGLKGPAKLLAASFKQPIVFLR